MAAALDQRAMTLTGHKSKEVFEEYANHRSEADFIEAQQATSEVFGRILDFQKVI
jgi:hypothetical protein